MMMNPSAFVNISKRAELISPDHLNLIASRWMEGFSVKKVV